MVDLNANLAEMGPEDLLAYQQEITRLRLDAIDAGRRVQTELDRRATERAEQRAAEDEAFGAVRKPASQQVFGSLADRTEAPRPDAGDDETGPTGVLRKADR